MGRDAECLARPLRGPGAAVDGGFPWAVAARQGGVVGPGETGKWRRQRAEGEATVWWLRKSRTRPALPAWRP